MLHSVCFFSIERTHQSDRWAAKRAASTHLSRCSLMRLQYFDASPPKLPPKMEHCPFIKLTNMFHDYFENSPRKKTSTTTNNKDNWSDPVPAESPEVPVSLAGPALCLFADILIYLSVYFILLFSMQPLLAHGSPMEIMDGQYSNFFPGAFAAIETWPCAARVTDTLWRRGGGVVVGWGQRNTDEELRHKTASTRPSRRL